MGNAILPKRDVMLEDVRIIWRNFAGAARQFNDEGKRNFVVILDEETALRLRDEDGYNVKQLKPRGEDTEGDWSLKVTVKFKGRPPRLVLITKSKGKRNVLDEDMAELLDVLEFETVDIILRPFDWDVQGKNGRAAYLKTIYATLHEDELDLKYSEYDDDAPHALPPGEDPNVLDGEIVDEYDDDERLALPRGRE
jgi:hypothetical protein